MRVLFSDLDGTLLHLQTYSAEAARPALRRLNRKRVPLVLCTSKTRAEVEFWREQLENKHPFIIENGGAIYIPDGYFEFPIPGAVDRDGYHVIEYGMPYAELVAALRAASRESGCRVLGFSDMSAEEVSARTLLPLEQAELAKRREYDEPFEIVGVGTHTLLNAINSRGMQWTRGDRFYHITGHNDKAEAVRALTALYRQAHKQVDTVGIGDGHNDVSFLSTVDQPIVIHSRFAVALKRAIPHSLVTQSPGPHGWNEAVLQLLDQPSARALTAT
jgi:mannosyl-3-phosphoglycerate phosphatase